MNHLQRIVAVTREEVDHRRSKVPRHVLEAQVAIRAGSDEPRGLAQALRREGLSVIAEHKRRSPSAGAIREGVALEEVVAAYERAGAAALSVLTEGPNFGGSLTDLMAARAAVELPILRKDFIVDPYQVIESFVTGADAILLIVAALTEDELVELHKQARGYGLDVLVEVHDDDELAIAAAAGVKMIGINNRDLTTLQVDTRRTFELLADVPEGTIVISESGFRSADELRELARAGVDAVLIGEALMRSPDIEAACRRLTEL